MYIDGNSVGITNDYQFHNSDESLFTVWAPNEPSSENGADCVQINPATGMESIPCDIELPILCENKRKFNYNLYYTTLCKSICNSVGNSNGVLIQIRGRIDFFVLLVAVYFY